MSEAPDKPPVRIITEEEAIERLRRLVERAPSLVAFAEQHGVSQGYVSMALRGKAKLGPQLQGLVGVSQVLMYRVFKE